MYPQTVSKSSVIIYYFYFFSQFSLSASFVNLKRIVGETVNFQVVIDDEHTESWKREGPRNIVSVCTSVCLWRKNHVASNYITNDPLPFRFVL